MSLRALRRALTNKVTQPDYAGLTNVVFHGRYEGLVTNTNNSYGVVDASGNVTKLKSVVHTTGHEFDFNNDEPTLVSSGINFAAGQRLRHTGASSAFTPFHYRATLTDLKWTVHAVVKFGTSSNPDTAYGLCGNNATSSTNRGFAIYFEDRASLPTNNALTMLITLGSATFFIDQVFNTNVINPNTFIDLWMEVDKSQLQENQVKLFINGQRVIVSNYVNSSSPSSSAPSFAMEIGATGNGVLGGVMVLKEITFQSGVMSESFRQGFITARMYKYGIVPFASSIDGINITSDWHLIDSLSESRYYLTNHLMQNNTNADVITSVFSDGVNHIFDDTKKVSVRKSTDKGRTWSSKTTAFDPAGGEGVGDPAAGRGSDDRIHVIADSHTSYSIGGTHKLYYGYSDDDGDTWSSFTNITAILPADSLATWRCYSNIIENNGRLMCPIYKVTDEGVFTNSAIYLLYSDDNGSTWGYKTIRASTTTPFLNESEIIALSSTALLVITRNETTGEWTQFISSDNGDTWTNQGDLTFGETLTLAGPVRLSKFQILGTDVIACYYSDRTKDVFKVVYAKPSDIISSGLAGWVVDRKFTIHQGSNNNHLHYGDVCHYDNDFKAIGQYVIDPFPPDGPGLVNTMYTFDIPTYHYSFIKSALGL